MRLTFLALGLLFIAVSCTPKSHWKHSQIDGGSQYSSSRLSYVVLNTPNALQLEVIRREKTCKGYLFVQGRKLPEDPKHPKQTPVFIQIEDTIESYLATRYAGGHRLLLPEDLVYKLLDALEKGSHVTVKTSGYATTLDPNGFSSHYANWKKNSHFSSFIKTSF